MYVAIRRYTNSTALFDELARRESDVRAVISSVPGFGAYYLVRSGDGGASITVCRDKAGVTESTRRAADWIRQNVSQAAGKAPEVTEGEVLYSFTA